MPLTSDSKMVRQQNKTEGWKPSIQVELAKLCGTFKVSRAIALSMAIFPGG